MKTKKTKGRGKKDKDLDLYMLLHKIVSVMMDLNNDGIVEQEIIAILHRDIDQCFAEM